MREENITLGIEQTAIAEGQVIDTLPEAMAAGDTIREHRRGIAASYSDLLGEGRFDPNNPEHLTYAQALNLEFVSLPGRPGFGADAVATVSGVIMIAVAWPWYCWPCCRPAWPVGRGGVALTDHHGRRPSRGGRCAEAAQIGRRACGPPPSVLLCGALVPLDLADLQAHRGPLLPSRISEVSVSERWPPPTPWPARTRTPPAPWAAWTPRRNGSVPVAPGDLLDGLCRGVPHST